MKLKNNDIKEKVNLRLRKIEGQVRGIQTMLDEERDCKEIMQQFIAVRSALQSVSRFFLQEYASECLLKMELDEAQQLSPGELHARREQVIQEMIAFLDKSP